MSLQLIDFHGQPVLPVRLPNGDCARVALHGGNILSWCTADGVEHLYLSPDAVFDGHTALRGGVPVCFPQFNRRGPLQKHGFARNLPWTPVNVQAPVEADGEQACVELLLRDGPATHSHWPESFELRLRLILRPSRMRVELQVRNSGLTPWGFSTALHTYLRVHDLSQVRLRGLQGAACWDSVRDLRFTEAAAALTFGDEFDRVYAAPARPLHLAAGTHSLRIAQSTRCTETVVWNPGPLLTPTLSDMPKNDWRHMLCVEAACIDEPVQLAAGASWQAWQELSVESAAD